MRAQVFARGSCTTQSSCQRIYAWMRPAMCCRPYSLREAFVSTNHPKVLKVLASTGGAASWRSDSPVDRGRE